MPTTPLSEIRKILKQDRLDAALISSPANVIYLTHFNHFHFEEREVFILITKKGQYIFTDARYSHAVKTHLKDFKLLEISMDNPFSKLLEKIIKEEKNQFVGN